jgi:hypothetical protein
MATSGMGQNRFVANARLGHPDDVRDGRLMSGLSERQTAREKDGSNEEMN